VRVQVIPIPIGNPIPMHISTPYNVTVLVPELVASTAQTRHSWSRSATDPGGLINADDKAVSRESGEWLPAVTTRSLLQSPTNQPTGRTCPSDGHSDLRSIRLIVERTVWLRCVQMQQYQWRSQDFSSAEIFSERNRHPSCHALSRTWNSLPPQVTS